MATTAAVNNHPTINTRLQENSSRTADAIDMFLRQSEFRPNLSSPTTDVDAQISNLNDRNANFHQLPREWTLRDKLGLSASNPMRRSSTPQSVSVSSVVLILQESIQGLKNISFHIPGLEACMQQLSDVKDTLLLREGDVQQFINITIDKASAPPLTPATTSLPPSSPSSPATPHHPFSRPTSEGVTLQHWIYDLQKNSWYLNEKTIRYESVVTTILTISSRKRKLMELAEKVHASWVNLMLHLGLVISQMNSESQSKTSSNLNRLVVATGLAEVVSGLHSDDFKVIYMQGEKHLLGYGVPQSNETAYKRFEVAGQNGLPEALNMLGVMNEFGIGCKKDMSSAIKYYMNAAAQNNHDAINHLGRLHELGKGCETSLSKAAKLYKKAAQLGNLDGITNFAHALQNGAGVAEQKELAVEYYKMAADKGYARALNALGTCYYQGFGVKQDFFEAIGYYKKSADQGYATALNNLGICFEEGRGTPRDLVQAKKYYHLASEKRHAGGTNNFAYVLLLEKEYLEAIDTFYLAKNLGSVDAIFQLGYLYEIGCSDKAGVVLHPDIDMAVRFYQEAGQKGHTQALLRLSSILICGPERLVNVTKAVECLKKVADSSVDARNPLPKGIKCKETAARDISEAQNMLGELCEMGLQDGVDGEPNVQTAMEWYRKALKHGHGRAMFNLAAIYEKGDVVPRDMDKAIRLFIEAEKKGNENARERLLKLQELGIISIQ